MPIILVGLGTMGQYCKQPFAIYKKGETPVIDENTGLPVRSVVPCGQCEACQANRKNDWTGRLIAEAKTAASMYFVTLTYKKAPEDFRYLDIQNMLKHFRQDLERNHGGTKVRFFCVGEKGNKTGRVHWHMLLFFDRPHKLERMKPGKLWQFWQHGWTNIEAVPSHDTVARVRYTAKYAVKTVGDEKSCRPRFSLKPGIGSGFLTKWVDDLVEAGLPIRGYYHLPGQIWERGHRKGEHVRYRLRGSVARKMADYYVERWIDARPNKPWPLTPWLQRYGQAAFMERRLRFPDMMKSVDLRLPDESVGEWGFFWKEIHVGDEPTEVFGRHVGGMFQRAPLWRERLAFDERDRYGKSAETYRAEKAERDSVREKEIEDRRAAARLFDLKHKHLEGTSFRRSQCERLFGFGVTSQGIETYIATGKVENPDDAEGRQIFDLAAVEGIDYRKENFPIREFVEPDYVRDYRENAFRFRRWAAGRGLEVCESIDAETGEIRHSLREWSTPRKSAETVQPPRISYTPKRGGLADRAVSRERGNPEVAQFKRRTNERPNG